MSSRIINCLQSLFANKKIYACSNVFYSLYFDWQNNIRICPKQNNGILIRDFDGLWLDTDKIKQNKKGYINKFKFGCPDLICSNCEYLKYDKFTEQTELKEIHLGHWKNCYLRCKYCNSTKNDNLLEAKHYNILPAINRLIDAKMLTQNTKIIFDCGDSQLHPEFDKLLYFFIYFESNEIIINSPAMTYRESIADAITKNAVKLVVNLDTANNYVYKYIKGEDTLDTAAGNIKRYIQYQEPKEKCVITKFTLYKGGNDCQKELSDFLVLSCDLGVNEIIIDIEENWYNELKKGIPECLKEMIIFIGNITGLNGITLNFSEKVQKLYDIIINKA